MIKEYESMIIFPGKIDKEEAEAENKKILDFIEKNGGEIIDSDDWGVRQLAYEIQSFKQGYYFINYFKFESRDIHKLERYYKINEKVIRFNLLMKPKGGNDE